MTEQLTEYNVIFIETVRVHSLNEDSAVAYATELRAFAGPDTEDIEVEELED